MSGRFSLALSLALVFAHCSGKADTATCGTGTSLSGKVCVASGSSGGAGSATTCGAGTVLTNGKCTVDASGCATGTVLTDGVCQPAATVCATGSTFDTGTKTCVAGITGCAANTVIVNGVCQAIVRLSVVNYADTSADTPAAYDWYMLSLSDYYLALINADDSSFARAIFVGTTDSYGSSGLTTTTLVPGESYVPFLLPPGQKLGVGVSPTALGKTYTFPIDLPTIAVVGGEPDTGVFALFKPVPGDQLLIKQNGYPGLALHLPFPPGTATASQSFVALATPTTSSTATFEPVGVIPADTHLQDPFGVDVLVGTWALTHGHLMKLGDALSLQNSGDLQKLFNITASSPDLTMAPGVRYICVPGPVLLATMPCFDDLAHGAASTPASYKVLSAGDLTGDLKITREVVNTFSASIELKQKGASGLTMPWSDATVINTLAHFLIHSYSSTQINFDLDDATITPVVLNTATLTMPALSNEPSFIVVAPKVGDPTKPDVTLIGERTPAAPIPSSTTLYTVVNSQAVSSIVNINATPAATIAVGANSDFSVTAACGSGAVTHTLAVGSQCYSFDPCAQGAAPHITGKGIVGQHVLVALTAGNPRIYTVADGAPIDLGAGTACP